jgi:glyoxylase-like metal-dependent hydrolase (beta-lactamase superfamily II)|tara:strand:- start:153 stop:1226 length:1074 start_codon:yes stop_codon:yes gene_type:complete
MKKSVSLFFCVTMMVAIPSIVGAQEAEYPIIVVPTGKGPYSFPEGYQTPWGRIEIMVTEKMSPNLFVLHGSKGLDRAHPDGSGGRVMVLFGPDGVLMVDTQNRQVAEKTMAAIRSFTDAPIKVLVNSHIHSDHTGANAFFANQGALIFAQENLRLDMINPRRPNGQLASVRDKAAIPSVTYHYDPSAPGEPAVTLNMNGETVDFIPMMPSHTAGDTVVRFRNANVIYIEDFYRNFGFPFAAQTSGGSIKGMIEAIDLFQTIAGPDTWLIPGHGTLIHREDLLPYRAMLVDILEKVTALRDEGKSLEEVLTANLTALYEQTTQGDTQQSKDRFIKAVYDEVKDFPPIVNGRRAMSARP